MSARREISHSALEITEVNAVTIPGFEPVVGVTRHYSHELQSSTVGSKPEIVLESYSKHPELLFEFHSPPSAGNSGPKHEPIIQEQNLSTDRN